MVPIVFVESRVEDVFSHVSVIIFSRRLPILRVDEVLCVIAPF